MQQPMLNFEDITDITSIMNMEIVLMAKVVQNAVQNLGVQNVGNQNGVIVVPGIANQNRNGNVVGARAEGNTNRNNGNQIRCYNCIGLGHLARNCTVRPRRRDAAYLQTQLLIAQKEEAGIQLQAEEFDLMATAADLDEIEEVNADCILMANLQQASTSGTQSDKAPYSKLLEPIPKPHQVLQNNSNVTSMVSSVEQGGETVEQHPENLEETRVLYDSLYNNLVTEVEKVNSFNRKLRETKANLTTELARYKNQEKCFEISQEKYDKLERCYQKSVYREQCLTKKINALHLSSGTSTNTKFANQSTERKLFLQSLRNKSVVRQPNAFQSDCLNFSKTRVPQKVDKTNDLSNLVTSNSVPATKESKVVDYDKVITPGMFRINPLKNSRKVKFVPNKPVNAIVRTNPITAPQPHVITKKVVNSDSHGFSSTGVDITTKPEGHNLGAIQRMIGSLLRLRVQCLTTENHDVYVLNYVNGMNYPCKKHKANVSNVANQMKHKVQIWKPKNVGSKERLASTEPSKPRMHLRWSPTGKMFDIKGKLIASSESNGDNACTPNPQEPTIKRCLNSTFSLGRSLFVKGNRTTNLYTINLHDMASASPICLMSRATSIKSWLWNQCLSHLNFDTINDHARNDLITGLSKFRYHKEHLCPSCEHEKSKRASHPPKPVPNSKQRLHLLHIDLCGPIRIANINGKRYVLVIMDDYSRYTWVVFLRSKDEAPKEIKTFLKKITVLLQAPVIIRWCGRGGSGVVVGVKRETTMVWRGWCGVGWGGGGAGCEGDVDGGSHGVVVAVWRWRSWGSGKKELEQAKVIAEAEVASMKAKPSYPDINWLTELLVTSLKPELSKLLASHDFASCLPTKLKEFPSKIIGLSREIKELKQHIKDMEIELPGDLKEIPSKLETFTSSIYNLSSQEKLKTLDSLPGLLKTVTNTLNRFATLVENASGATTTGVLSADKATASPAEGEKDTDTNLKKKLVDLLGIDIVTHYYNKNLLYERYCAKMKKIRQSSKIINCDVLTKKGPYLTEVQAYPDRKEKGWKTIYELIKTIMKYLEQNEKELHIDFNKSLQEQDPLDELNDLANKKRKRTGDSIDNSRLKFKFEGDNTPIVIQPPCYFASVRRSLVVTIWTLALALGIAWVKEAKGAQKHAKLQGDDFESDEEQVKGEENLEFNTDE
nr:retrovirus-related Pol polyprotein from transposon TNT 1-94 [Tanacetum cinerariifolium]